MSKFLGGIAADVYGVPSTGGGTLDLIPRSKFQFSLGLSYLDPFSGGFKTLSLDRIASVDMPGHSFRTTELNQYNKKRIIQTGVDYNPITLVAYDTRDAELETFLTAYTQYYYAGTRSFADIKYVPDTVTPDFAGGVSGAGYRLLPQKYCIKSFTIVRRSSDEDVNIISVYNPMIQSIDHDTLDYSDSGFVQYKITFSYEGYGIGYPEDVGKDNDKSPNR